MSGIVGGVFLITMASCLFGLIDQTYQAIKRVWRSRRSLHRSVGSPVLRTQPTQRWKR